MASSLPPHLASTSTTPSSTSTPRASRNRPSPQASPQNTSPTSRSPRTALTAGLDVETLLRNHNGDVRKALEVVVAERNHLQSQNSQLWKLIEKQRSQSSHLNNDNERLRGDREKANVRLAAAGLDTVGHVRKFPNSSSAVGLGIQADQPSPPSIPRRNSDRDEPSESVPAIHAPIESTSPRHTTVVSPPTTSTHTLLPSAMPSKLRHESRMQFPPEVSSFMTLADSPRETTHTIPASTSSNTLSPSSQYSSTYSPSPTAIGKEETSSGLTVPQSSRQLASMAEEDEEDSHLVPPRVSSLKSPSMESTSTHSSFHSAAQSPPMQNRSRSGDSPLPRPSTDTETVAVFTNRETPSRPAPDAQPPRPSQDTQASTSIIPDQHPVAMTSPLLPHARITVPDTTIYPNALGRDVLCFIIHISVRPPNSAPITWNVAKLLSAFIDLDGKLKIGSRKSTKEWRHMTAPLPDGKAWKDFAPSKIDQRKSALEAYLKSLQVAPISDKSDLCDFLSTDIVQAKAAGQRKEGYLTKKKNFGGWKTRYFVLDGPVMEFFETRGGQSLGSIVITNAQIGRQHRPSEYGEERDFRHAFLIIENPKKGASTRHVLCAASDTDRDSWIEMLVQHVDPKPAPTMAPSSSVTSVPSISRISSPPAPSAPAISAAPSNSNGILQRKRSTSKKMSKDVVVTNAQPMGSMPTTGKFANLPSPGMINSLEAQKAAQTPPIAQGNTSTPISQSSTLMSVSDTSQSVQTDRSNGRPSISDDQAPTPRANKRQSSVPPRQYTPAYLTKLSTDGLSAPPGSMPDPRDRDRDRKAKSGRFWPSFGKTPEKITRPVFGVSLSESLAIASVASLPAVVFRCIEWLESNKAQDEEGVYRMSGSSAVIKGLKDRFDLEGDVNLVKLDERWDPHAIAGLLKTFLRELPTSLLTRELHPKFLAVMDLIDSSARVAELTRLVSDLPPRNYALLRSLTAHLILIVKHSHINKMTLRNIGIVFSPTLGIPAGIFSELVSHFGAIFDAISEEEVPEAVEPVVIPAQSISDEGKVEGDETIRRNRNSMLYQAAGADAMLGLGGRSLDPATDDSASEASIVDYESDTQSQSHHSQSGQSSNDHNHNHDYDHEQDNDEASASPTTPKAKVDHYPSASAVRKAKAAARGLDLGPNPVSNSPSRGHGNGHSNGQENRNGHGQERGYGYKGQGHGNGRGNGHGHDGLPVNSHSQPHSAMEGVAR